MLFVDFVGYLEKLEKTSSRLELTRLLSELIGDLSVEEVQPAMYLLLGRVSPKFSPLEFNYSVKLIIKALDGSNSSLLFGYEETSYAEELFKKHGDIGLTIEEFIISKANRVSKQELMDVYDFLVDLVGIQGSGSQSVKTEKVQNILRKLSPIEGKYVGRIIVGKLRLGVNDKTILDALSWFKRGDKSLREDLTRAFGVCTDIGMLAKVVVRSICENLIEELSTIKLTPGVPVASKLVEREKDSSVIFDRMNEMYVQPKLDGLRIQIHKWVEHGKSRVELYSRNLENMTAMFPEVVEAVLEMDIESVVFDSEVIGYSPKTGNYLPFQDTIQRKRKNDIDIVMKSIPVRGEIFDILFLDGEDLTEEPIETRLKILQGVLSKNDSTTLRQLKTVFIVKQEELERFFNSCVEDGLEGVIAKLKGTVYGAGTRNFDWIKLKASARKDMVDSVDAVVMGYYLGGGKRSKFGVGAILIGVFDPVDDNYKTIAKVGTGITEEQLQTIKADLDALKIQKPNNYMVDKNLEADVYVKPEIIVVVEADEITRSKMHSASIDSDGRGLSLRFPRLIEWNRKDKGIEDADTTESLAKMFMIKN
jgi:DNA ligase 1